jgi:hypothetical protein
LDLSLDLLDLAHDRGPTPQPIIVKRATFAAFLRAAACSAGYRFA